MDAWRRARGREATGRNWSPRRKAGIVAGGFAREAAPRSWGVPEWSGLFWRGRAWRTPPFVFSGLVGPAKGLLVLDCMQLWPDQPKIRVISGLSGYVCMQ